MKNFAKSKGKRITAALLCAVMCIMSLPLSAFAFTAEEGKTVDAYYGDRYFGSDGDYYYSPESYQYTINSQGIPLRIAIADIVCITAANASEGLSVLLMSVSARKKS